MKPIPKMNVVAKDSVGFALVCSMCSNSLEVVEMVVVDVQFLLVVMTEVVAARYGVLGEKTFQPSFAASAERGVIDWVVQ